MAVECGLHELMYGQNPFRGGPDALRPAAEREEVWLEISRTEQPSLLRLAVHPIYETMTFEYHEGNKPAWVARVFFGEGEKSATLWVNGLNKLIHWECPEDLIVKIKEASKSPGAQTIESLLPITSYIEQLNPLQIPNEV